MHVLDNEMHDLNLPPGIAASLPMFENFNLTLLTGGYYRTTASWSRDGNHFDQCYKIYLPVGGKATLETAESTCTISPGNLYFVPGYHLQRQSCTREMLVHWVHFTPESYYLHHRLSAIRSVVAWPLRKFDWVTPDFLRIGQIFDDPDRDQNHLRPDPPLELVCRIEAILMYLVADLLDAFSPSMGDGIDPELARLKPAMDFMDAFFRSNPSLEEIAGKAHLAANYFHRLFKSKMSITPFEYMERKRLDGARRLLGDRRLSMKQVAALSGYENALYFSRVFRRRFGCPPTAFREFMTP